MLDKVDAYTTGRPRPGESSTLADRRPFWNDFRYCRDREIFGEAESADYVYQVRSGAVRTFKLLPDGRRQIGAFHLSGDIFGIENGEAYRFTAEAIVNTSVRVARREAVFGKLFEAAILPGVDVLKLVARNLQHAEDHVLLLGRQTALERIAVFLTEMDRRLNSPKVLMLPMGRRDIADYLGLTHETVSRTLSILRRDGILGFPGQTQREIVLHHRSRLAQLAFSSETATRLS
jgi:CRP/FNR family transcriptional regulator, nitrogen fixation regulation protein